LENIEAIRKAEYKESTSNFEAAQADYLTEMRERYIEEQMFSDRIKSASTWWTWGLISTHLFLFVMIQFYVEPKKKLDLQDNMKRIITETAEAERKYLNTLISSIITHDAENERLSINADTENLSSSIYSFNDSKFYLGMISGLIMTIALLRFP
jgi:sensitive to high expression protein 9